MVHRPRLADTAAAQRRVLEDPLVWQHEVWDAIFGSGPVDRLVPAAPAQSDQRFREAIGVAGDMANNYAGEVGCFGMELGCRRWGMPTPAPVSPPTVPR